MFFLASTSHKNDEPNPEISTDSSENIEKLINYKIDSFPSIDLMRYVSDRNTRLDEIKNGSLDIAVVDDISCNIESYDCSVSLYVLLKCLVNC